MGYAAGRIWQKDHSAEENSLSMELNEIVHDIHYKISGGREDLVIEYEPNIEDDFFEDELIRVTGNGI